MKLSYAKAATLALTSSALLQASVCSRSVDIQEPRAPQIERLTPEPRQNGEPAAPEPPVRQQEPGDRPDAGAPRRRRESPTPYEPIREELQSRVASR